MSSRLMMSLNAAFLAALGIAATFLPQELAALLELADQAPALHLFEIAGGLYLGFAILNWSVREMAIGGIYNRPVLLGNLLHFTVVGLALARGLMAGERAAPWVALTILYLAFAGWFGSLLFRSPTRSDGA